MNITGGILARMTTKAKILMLGNIAISSASLGGLSEVGSMLPNINILALVVIRARMQPVMFTSTSMQDGVL